MGQLVEIFDLGRLALASGEGRRLELELPLEPFEFGGQRYAPTADRLAAVLDVARTRSGYSLRLRFGAELAGPCMRCLEPALQPLEIDAREIDQPGDGEDLRSPYLDGDDLDLRAWARDAIGLALPTQVVCREACLGLCPVCGANLNHTPAEHAHERAPDPRWAALRELRIE